MPRVFAGLAIGHLIVLIGAYGLGWAVSVLGAQRHVLLGVFALLLAALCQAVVITYFAATRKMMSQAVGVAHMEATPILTLALLKRTATRWMAAQMVLLVCVAATGATAWRSGSFSVSHTGLATLLLLLQAWVYWRQYALISMNASLLERTMRAHSLRKESWEAGGSDAPA